MPPRAEGLKPNSAARSLTRFVAPCFIATAGCAIVVPLPASIVDPLRASVSVASRRSATASQ